MPKFCAFGADYSATGNWAENPDNYKIPNIPKEIQLPSGETLKTNSESLTYEFVLNEEQGKVCSIQFFVLCKKLVKTAGMGDTISGTGFIFHEPKPIN